MVRFKPFTWLVVDGILGKLNPIMPEVYVRALWAEENVESSIQQGVDQIIILGAGYDTFALRRQDLLESVQLWEIDQAATQREKLRRMQKHGLPKPANTHYVEANLEQDPLHNVLQSSSVDLGKPTVIVWLGVTYYLTEEAIKSTLESVSGHMATGSVLCMDYMADVEHTPESWRELREGCAAFVAKRGEPWITAYDPSDVPAFLQSSGFSLVDNMPPDQIAPHYLHRHPTIVFPEIMGFARAVI